VHMVVSLDGTTPITLGRGRVDRRGDYSGLREACNQRRTGRTEKRSTKETATLCVAVSLSCRIQVRAAEVKSTN
jgi:hypothetical protein